MITCRAATASHTEAREGALGPLRAALYRFHMSICPQCKAYHRGFQQTLDALGQMPVTAAPEPLKDAALAALRAKRNPFAPLAPAMTRVISRQSGEKQASGASAGA